jgi:hypothetical protein
MWDPLYGQVIAWVGLALLAVLCLPIARIQKLLLEVSAWALRLALLGVLGAAAYLWFRPQELPVQVTETLEAFPPLGTVLPEPGAQHFGICMAALLVAPLLPVLAVLDVSRQVAGGRLRRLRTLAAEAKAADGSLAAPPASATPAHPVRRVDRRSAAAALADAGSRVPLAGAPGRPDS